MWAYIRFICFCRILSFIAVLYAENLTALTSADIHNTLGVTVTIISGLENTIFSGHSIYTYFSRKCWDINIVARYRLLSMTIQENCGTKAADVLDKFFSHRTLMRIHRKCWCICNYYDFKTPIDAKCYSICHRLAVI